MGIAILVAVAALLAAYSGYCIKAAFIFAEIVMNVVLSMFSNGNFFEGFLSDSSSAVMKRGMADFSYIALALAAGIIFVNFVIGIIRAITAPMLNEKAEPIGVVVANMLKANIMIFLFYGVSSSLIVNNTPQATGITMRSALQGGMIGVYSRLLGNIGKYFGDNISKVGSIKDGFMVAGVHPSLVIITLVLGVSAFSAIIGAAVTFLERVYSIVIQIVIGPICLAFYSGQDTKDIPKMWMTQLIGMGLAMIVSLWLWGVMVEICSYMVNAHIWGTGGIDIDLRGIPLVGGLLDATIGKMTSSFLAMLAELIPGGVTKQDVLKSYYTVIILLLVVITLAQLIKNSERIFNSVGLKTMPSGDLARAVAGGMRGTMMAIRAANGIAAATGRTAGALAAGTHPLQTHPLQQMYARGKSLLTGGSSLPKLNTSETGQGNLSKVLGHANKTGSLLGKDSLNSQIGKNSIGIGGSSLNAGSHIIPATTGTGKQVGLYKTADGTTAVVGSGLTKKDLGSGFSIEKATGKSFGLSDGALGSDGKYHMNGNFTMAAASEDGKLGIATGNFDVPNGPAFGDKEAHNGRAVGQFLEQSYNADLNSDNKDADPFNPAQFNYQNNEASDAVEKLHEAVNDDLKLDAFREDIEKGKYDDIIRDSDSPFRDLQNAYFDDYVPDDVKAGFNSYDDFENAINSEADVLENQGLRDDMDDLDTSFIAKTTGMWETRYNELREHEPGGTGFDDDPFEFGDDPESGSGSSHNDDGPMPETEDSEPQWPSDTENDNILEDTPPGENENDDFPEYPDDDSQ